MMNKIAAAVAILCICLCAEVAWANLSTTAVKSATTASSALKAAGPLVSSLMKAVPGLSQAQTALGAGSLFALAKGKMVASQFSAITKAVPGVDALIAQATQHGLPKPLNSLADVSKFLGKSGISPTQVNQLASALDKNVAPKVSPDVAKGFAASFK